MSILIKKEKNAEYERVEKEKEKEKNWKGRRREHNVEGKE